MFKLIKFLIALFLLILSFFFKGNEIVYLILILSSYIICSYTIIYKAILDIIKGKFLGENFLIALATITAIILKEYVEAVAVILFYTLGITFEHFALDKSRKSIKELMDIKPDYANLVKNEVTKEDCFDIKVDDIIRCYPGEKVPLDGIVIKGSASLDTSSITGESNLVDVTNNDSILSGCINVNGIIDIKVTKLFSESTVYKILQLVENATNSKAKQEQFIRKFAKIYTPVVVLLSIIISLIIPLLFNQDFSIWIYRGLNFLVISCPCALVISIPMSFFSGIASASKIGVLIKGSNYFEAINNIDTIVLDKTGTVTKGIFEVKDIILNNINKEEFIKYAILSEYNSNHPLANTIKSLSNINVDNDLYKDYKEEIGYGISMYYNNDYLICGNKKIMDKYNITIKEEVGTVVYFSLNNKYIGAIILEDRIKEDTINVIDTFKKLNKEVIMLSGDNINTVTTVCNEINITNYKSNLLPHEKVEELELLIKDNKKVMFVGDGINDAPALKLSDVGVSMGGVGSNAAIEASDVVLMHDDLSKIIEVFKISKRTLRICMQNIIFAISIKVIVLILSTTGLTNLWMAIFADVGVSILAIMNSLRILLKKDTK